MEAAPALADRVNAYRIPGVRCERRGENGIRVRVDAEEMREGGAAAAVAEARARLGREGARRRDERAAQARKRAEAAERPRGGARAVDDFLNWVSRYSF